jgi:hypothetical protein
MQCYFTLTVEMKTSKRLHNKLLCGLHVEWIDLVERRMRGGELIGASVSLHWDTNLK